MEKTVALELKNVSKHFGEVMANKNVNLTVNAGEILAILGENGSGKTTLMNMIAGIYYPDEGQIFVRGEEVVIASPHDAFRYKIGMIHQHFKLVDVFTAAQNIVLGVKDSKRYKLAEVNAQVNEAVVSDVVAAVVSAGSLSRSQEDKSMIAEKRITKI